MAETSGSTVRHHAYDKTVRKVTIDNFYSVYVPWNVQRLRDTKTITVRTASRQNTNRPAATWKLRVTQIECQGSGLFGRDGPMRAPAGCLQYFVEPAGSFESFNLNNRTGPYLGNMTYGICFRRRPHDAQLRYFGSAPPSMQVQRLTHSAPTPPTDYKQNVSK